jgi:hypothetical protein
MNYLSLIDLTRRSLKTGFATVGSAAVLLGFAGSTLAEPPTPLPVAPPLVTLPDAPATMRFEAPDESRDSAFILLSGFMVAVLVRVNHGEQTFWFVLDTGFTGCAIDTERVKLLKVPLSGGERKVHGYGGDTTALGVADLFFSLPGVLLHDPEVVPLPLGDWSPSVVTGVLGYPFFKNAVVVVDYQARRVRVRDPKTFRYNGKGVTIPLRFGNCPAEFTRERLSRVETVIVPHHSAAPLRAVLVLDTGIEESVSLNAPFVRAQTNLLQTGTPTAPYRAKGVGGVSRGRLGRLRKVAVGGLTLNQPVAVFGLERV